MFLLNIINDWYVDIKLFVNNGITPAAFITILCLMSVAILAIAIYIVKHSFNVAVVKKNLTLPIIFIVLFSAVLVMLCIMRYV